MHYKRRAQEKIPCHLLITQERTMMIMLMMMENVHLIVNLL